jgi:Holliday junction resolvase RusA-like endonuclease
MAVRLVLPLPPSVNAIYKRSRSGGVYLDKKVREFRDAVQLAVENSGMRTITGRFRAKVTLHPNLKDGDQRAWDANNREKALWDALEHAGAIENDKNDYDVHRVRGEPKPPHGMCVVEIFEMR